MSSLSTLSVAFNGRVGNLRGMWGAAEGGGQGSNHVETCQGKSSAAQMPPCRHSRRTAPQAAAAFVMPSSLNGRREDLCWAVGFWSQALVLSSDWVHSVRFALKCARRVDGMRCRSALCIQTEIRGGQAKALQWVAVSHHVPLTDRIAGRPACKVAPQCACRVACTA